MSSIRRFLSGLSVIAPAWDYLAGLKNSRRSYSQFAEDAAIFAIIRKLRQHAEFQWDRHMFLEIGACVPIRGSNTYAFARNGWRGVLIEPSPKSATSFALLRPESRLIKSAISNKSESIKFYSFGNGSVFNTPSHDQALRVEEKTGNKFRVKTIPAVPLTDALASVGYKFSDFGVVSLDVEGHEQAVLEGADFDKDSPYIFAIEILNKTPLGILQSTISTLMESKGYRAASICPPSAIFLRNDLAAMIFDAKS